MKIFVQKIRNPTHGSGWMIQILSTDTLIATTVIPLTAVGGYFRSLLIKELNNPPTAVGGIPTID
jgi:hypothetical protein